MENPRINVIATTISGSIKDWGKVKHIIPLFNNLGMNNVNLFVTNTHKEAREKTRECIKNGTRIIISAGGSGTFNSVLEGCCDSNINLNEIILGFLRKGSADLIGKTLGMPDNIEDAIKVFVNSINNKRTVKCDVILAESEAGDAPARHFVGYGGAEIFGMIPTFTENKFIKYYKGILGQIFGDLGPFTVGATLASTSKILKIPFVPKIKWSVFVDDKKVSENYYQAFIIVNGDLGKDLKLAKSVPLGSGDFYMFALRDIGIPKLPGQIKHIGNSSILKNPDKWGFEQYCIKKSLRIMPNNDNNFKVNVDGATMLCKKSAMFHICDQINLITK